LTCPLIANGKAIGFLFFSSNKPGTYTDAHTDAYQEIAALVSLAVERSRAFEELLETKKRLVATNSALARAAYFDALTGIPSRRYFDLVFEREWKRATRHSEPLALIIADVDHFKLYNDLYGHPAGDECLRRVAQSLLGAAKRGTDLVARIGGEEFAALLPHTRPADALAFAERLREGVEGLAISNGRSPIEPYVTLSLGVACAVPGRELEANALLRVADAALYRAKEGGRNRAVLTELHALENRGEVTAQTSTSRGPRP
jgi:diguanylate cyclase (GGDEF)-like protein